MGKQEEIRSLTWKYFIQQKARELSKPIIYILLGIIIPFGLYLIYPLFEIQSIAEMFLVWYAYALIIVLLYFFCFIIYRSIYCVFYEWIKSNWKEARNRAKRDVNKKPKGGKR